MCRRLKFLGLLCLALGCAGSSAGEQVVFSEVMYHPATGAPEFVEIENLTATPFDIAEWELREAVSFTFPKFDETDPNRTFLKAFERIVVCGVDPSAFRQHHALDDSVRIFGPWTGNLSNGGERITLEDKNGVTRCTLRYEDDDLWPVAPDGSGHSLVLTDTSRAIDDYRWWRASARRGGSPGLANATVPGREDRPTINEIRFTPEGQVDWVELYNSSNGLQTLEGHALSLSRDLSQKISLTGNLAPEAHRSWDLSPRPADFPTEIYLLDPNDDVIDAVKLRDVAERLSLSVYPDGGTTFYASDTGTRNASNAPRRVTEIVINELMVETPVGGREGEFIELHNRGVTTVDLSGWQFDQGVAYTFPAGTSLAPGAYLAIAADASALTDAHPGVAILGDYEGSLANRGEFLRLIDAWGNQVDALHYQTGGDWPPLAMGQGSSLELRHPSMDNESASAWADSDESAKSSFQTFSFTEDYLDIDSGGLANESDYEELHLHAVGDAHLALRNLKLTVVGDDSNVLPNGGTSIVTNGVADTGWLCQGTHHGSFVQNDEFHLVSSGHGDVKANRCEIDVTAISQGDTLTFTTEARWISGKPTLVVQTWDRTFGSILHLPVPPNLGTPGAPNSALIGVPAPTVSHLRHEPAVPTTSDPVHITAQVQSATVVQLKYRLDSASGEAPWQSVPMTNAGHGQYVVTLTDFQTDGAIVQFYVQAFSSGGESELPRGGSSRPAMWIVDDTVVPRDLRTQRFILPARALEASGEAGDSEAFDYHFPRLSNQYFNATFISNEEEVIYNCEFRKSGSPWTRRETADFSRAKWKTPADRPFRGYTKRSLDNDINSPFRPYHNRLTRYWLYLLGHPASENEFVRVVLNGDDPILREDVEPVANDFLKRNWKDGQLGELYRIDDEWLFTDDWDFRSGNATWAYKDSEEPERYHAEWMKRSREAEYDYAAFVSWVRTLDEDTFTQAEMEALADIDLMAANAAVRGWIDDWDTLTRGRGKNGYFYRRVTDNRWMLLQWDSDGAFRDVDAPFLGSLDGVPEFFGKPYVQQRFKLYLGELIDRYTHESARLTTWFQCEEDASSAYETISDFYHQWNEDRVVYAQQEIGESLLTSFKLSTPNPTVTSPILSLSGDSPYNADAITVVGHSEARARFTSPSTWEVSGIALEPGDNTLLLLLLDHQGSLLATQQAVVAYTGVGQPSLAQESLRITEIMYHPDDPALEFLELANLGNTALALEGVTFEAALPFGQFAFADQTLSPGEHAVLVVNEEAFLEAYGAGPRILGQWSGGALSNGGERILLRDAAGATILDFAYDDALPWPTEADGEGRSLEILDPDGDYSDSANWIASAVALGTPGRGLDRDGDGLSDRDEATRNTSPTNPDTDGDGASDGAEVIAGTDPRDWSSVLTLRALPSNSETGSAVLLWSSVPGKTYRIEFSDSLEGASWAPVTTVIAESSETTVDVQGLRPNEFQRFYRAVVVQD